MFIRGGQRPRTVNTILKKKNKAGGLYLTSGLNYYIKLHYPRQCGKLQKKKKMWYWQKSRHINQWNRIGPHKYSKLIFDKGAG